MAEGIQQEEDIWTGMASWSRGGRRETESSKKIESAGLSPAEGLVNAHFSSDAIGIKTALLRLLCKFLKLNGQPFRLYLLFCV